MKRSRGPWPASGNGFRPKGIAGVLLAATLAAALAGCGPRGLEGELDRITAGQRFDLARWQIGQVFGDLGRPVDRPADLAGRADEVERYFANPDDPAVSVDAVTAVIEAQVRQAYHEAGIDNPFRGVVRPEIGFPPVNVHLDRPPNLLVISPRDHIERITDVLLLPDVPVETREKIEDEVSALGYSGLVVGLGGVATYPSYVSDRYGVRFALETAAHEWAHQYLAFTPLGFDYLLAQVGLNANPDIAALNETVASIVGEEIGAAVYDRYYAAAEPPDASPPPDFDFNAALRETRLTVDRLLAEGNIDAAEVYMEERRVYVNARGYDIRKLNQAYFAFYGAYTSSPASVDPLGQELRDLRDRSGSLKAFLDAMSAVTTRDEVRERLGR